MVAALVVGGRTFAPVDPDALTARRDDWIQVRVLDAQIDKLPALVDQAEDVAREILTRAMRAGVKAELLAGALDEIADDGRRVPWSRERAAQVAEFFDGVTDPDDRAAVTGAFLDTLLALFPAALDSSRSSPTSGGPSQRAAPPTPAAPSPVSPALTSSAATSRPTPRSNAPAPAAAHSARPSPHETLAPTPSAPGHPSPA